MSFYLLKKGQKFPVSLTISGLDGFNLFDSQSADIELVIVTPVKDVTRAIIQQNFIAKRSAHVSTEKMIKVLSYTAFECICVKQERQLNLFWIRCY